MWSIKVEHLNGGFKPELSLYVKEGDMGYAAIAISHLYPEERVTLWGKARGRLVVKGGEIIVNNDDLSEFYTNVTEEDSNTWKNFLPFPLQEWESVVEKDDMWCIGIEDHSFSLVIAEGDIEKTMRAISLTLPEEIVTLTAKVSVRVTMQNGEIIVNNDDLSKLLEGVSDNHAYSWKNLYQFHKE